MKTKEMIEVMQAHLEGEEIEYRDPSSEKWATISDPRWNWVYLDYRVKRQPMEEAETTANARLIASAPELYECLKAAVLIIGHPDDAMTKHFVKILSKARGGEEGACDDRP